MKDYTDYDDTGAVMVGGFIQPQRRHPFAGTHLDPARKGYQGRTLEMAFRELFPPDGCWPADMTKAEINERVRSWYEARSVPHVYRPCDRQVRRHTNGC